MSSSKRKEERKKKNQKEIKKITIYILFNFILSERERERKNIYINIYIRKKEREKGFLGWVIMNFSEGRREDSSSYFYS